MALYLILAWLLVFTTSFAIGGETPSSSPEAQLTAAAGMVQDAVAVLSSVDDPSEKCLSGTKVEIVAQDDLVVGVLHYNNNNDTPWGLSNRVYCANLTVAASGNFPFGLCEDDQNVDTAQMLYFDGKSCILGRFPLNGQDQCILWVFTQYKDDVPEECVNKFDELCGSEKYVLYDKELCE